MIRSSNNMSKSQGNHFRDDHKLKTNKKKVAKSIKKTQSDDFFCNVNKDDFLTVVQHLTGLPPVGDPADKQRRPPPLAPVTRHLPPPPPPSRSALSPLSGYIQYLETSLLASPMFSPAPSTSFSSLFNT